MKIRRAAEVTIQTPQDGICWNHDLRRYHPASGFPPALDSRSVVAPYVSLYLGLLSFELPFRENLSEGSVLFVEYFLYSIVGWATDFMLNFFKELRGSVPRQSRQLPTSGNILMET
jgi:hypothetical protein